MLLISALDLGYNQRELLWLHPIFHFTHFTSKELQVKPQKLRSDKPEPLTKQMLNMAQLGAWAFNQLYTFHSPNKIYLLDYKTSHFASSRRNNAQESFQFHTSFSCVSWWLLGMCTGCPNCTISPLSLKLQKCHSSPETSRLCFFSHLHTAS